MHTIIPLFTLKSVYFLLYLVLHTTVLCAQQETIKLSQDLQGYKSSLPLILIQTKNSKAILGKGFHRLGDGLKQVPRVPATLELYDLKSPLDKSSAINKVDLRNMIGIRGRGSYSNTWQQKPYSFEFWNKDQQDISKSILDLPKDSDWILYYPDPSAADRDPTLLYNVLIWRLGQQVGRYAPRFRFVEVFINEDDREMKLSDRRGLYVLVEKIKRSPDRLSFEKLSKDGKKGGWMLSINRMDPEPESGWPAANGASTPQFFHTAGPNRIQETPANAIKKHDDLPEAIHAHFNFENPSGYKINKLQRSAIEGFLKEFEDVLYNDQLWRDPEHGYRKYIDISDFIDFLILNNLAQNHDGLLLSIYPWRSSLDGKLRMGPAWDFNWGAFDQSGSPEKPLFYHQKYLWYKRLLQDPDFYKAHLSRWEELRKTHLSDTNIAKQVDLLVMEIGQDQAIAQGIDSIQEWQKRVRDLKNWLLERTQWIDNNLKEINDI